jgi:hypothetical protein
MVVFVMASLVIVLIVTLISGVAALPLALGAISLLAAIVLAFRGLVGWFSGDGTRV